MSVAIQKSESKVPEVSDELEAFFYVIVSYSLHYLPSNAHSVPKYLKCFFDACTLVSTQSRSRPGAWYMRRSVGELKETIMTRLHKEFPANAAKPSLPETLKFDSPMDDVIHELLRSFQAFYSVHKYDSQQPKVPPPPATDTNSSSFIPLIRFHDDPSGDDDSDEEFREIMKSLQRQKKPKWEPTAEDRDLAENVKSHHHMARILNDLGLEKIWPDIEKRDPTAASDYVRSRRDPSAAVIPLNIPFQPLLDSQTSSDSHAPGEAEPSKKRRKLSPPDVAPQKETKRLRGPPKPPKTLSKSGPMTKTKAEARTQRDEGIRRSARLLGKRRG